jgi:hypothetical protein
LEHPDFKEMLNIAATATKGIKIPNQKQTRSAVVEHFKQNLIKLRSHLQVHYFIHTAVDLPKYIVLLK